jgi:hypothetical protein
MADTRALRLNLYAGCALLLIALSLLPLMTVVSLGRVYWLYVVADTNRFYTPLNEPAAKTHDFLSPAVQLLRPAVPYMLLFALLQSGAAHALTTSLSRSAFFEKRPLIWGLCLTTSLTAVMAALLWVNLPRLVK